MATPPDTSCLANPVSLRDHFNASPLQTSDFEPLVNFLQLHCAVSEMQTRWWDKPAGLPYRRKRFGTSRPWRFGGGANRQVCPTGVSVSKLRGHSDSVVGQTGRFALPAEAFRNFAAMAIRRWGKPAGLPYQGRSFGARRYVGGGGPALATSGHQLVPYPMHGDQVLRLAAVVAQLSSQLHDHLIQRASGAEIIVAPNLV